MIITSISGIRGTIGGLAGENLTPVDVVSFASAFAAWNLSKKEGPTIIIGRDARKSGEIIASLIIATLRSMNVNVIDLGLATTPTVQMMVAQKKAQGAIIITASHNPKEYNGLKMLNEKGEFLSTADGQEILAIAEKKEYVFADIDSLGSLDFYEKHTDDHVKAILDLDLVNSTVIKDKKFKVVVDAINSVGGIAVPALLERLGVQVIGLYTEPNGEFKHAPEPLEKNLQDLKKAVIEHNADLGIAVDPDVDRLVLVDERGNMFGEEYTIVAVADYVLSKRAGNTVSNLSSSRALSDVATKHDSEYFASKVGEKNVVEKMKEVSAVIGGEGSGGVIYPELHYGRDALVGIALFLMHLAEQNMRPSTLRGQYSDYFMAKEKITLTPDIDVDYILSSIYEKYQDQKISHIDGVKIDFSDSWVHLRKSNTEPIIRIYTEAKTQDSADKLAQKFIEEISNI